MRRGMLCCEIFFMRKGLVGSFVFGIFSCKKTACKSDRTIGILFSFLPLPLCAHAYMHTPPAVWEYIVS